MSRTKRIYSVEGGTPHTQGELERVRKMIEGE